MTNTELLEKRVKQSGLKYSFIAVRLGISMQALYLKRKGQYPFTQYEIQELCNLLGITRLQEKEEIFFSKGVH